MYYNLVTFAQSLRPCLTDSATFKHARRRFVSFKLSLYLLRQQMLCFLCYSSIRIKVFFWSKKTWWVLIQTFGYLNILYIVQMYVRYNKKAVLKSSLALLSFYYVFSTITVIVIFIKPINVDYCCLFNIYSKWQWCLESLSWGRLFCAKWRCCNASKVIRKCETDCFCS